MRRLALLLPALLLVAACDSSSPEDALVGTWTLTAAQIDTRVTSSTAQTIPDRTVEPVVEREVSGVHPVGGLKGAGSGSEDFPDPFRVGTEPAIESGQQERSIGGRFAATVELDQSVQLLGGERHRLLEEDGSSGLEGTEGLRGVRVVAAGDQDGIEIGILQDVVGVGRCPLETELLGDGSRAGPGPADRGLEGDARSEFSQMREVNALAEASGADHSEADPTSDRGGRTDGHQGAGLRRVIGVTQQHPDRSVLSSQGGEGFAGLLEIEFRLQDGGEEAPGGLLCPRRSARARELRNSSRCGADHVARSRCTGRGA